MQRQKKETVKTVGKERRGQSFFRHTQISWIFSEDYGLTVAHIRCGICLMPLESVAFRIGQEVYLVCEEGHLIGNETDPQEAKIEWARLALNEKREREEKKLSSTHEAQRSSFEISVGKKNTKQLQESENTVGNDEHVLRFTNRQDYNNKLESLARLFKESHFRRIFQQDER